jgi:predicted nucleic acid-binding protein
LRFWDSSAIVPLLVDEPATDAVRAALEKDPTMLVWWATGIECVSAIARLERHGDLAPDATLVALQRLDALAGGWHEVQPVESVRRAARRALRVHSLHTADALQLAAATVGSEGQPASLDVVSLDDRLSDAARREGFAVLEPTAERSRS